MNLTDLIYLRVLSSSSDFAVLFGARRILETGNEIFDRRGQKIGSIVKNRTWKQRQIESLRTSVKEINNYSTIDGRITNNDDF